MTTSFSCPPHSESSHQLLGTQTQIRDNLEARIVEAKLNGWLGEVQGLQTSLAKAREKLTSLDRSTHHGSGPTDLGMPIVATPPCSGRDTS
jgi:hypothetical protein